MGLCVFTRIVVDWMMDNWVFGKFANPNKPNKTTKVHQIVLFELLDLNSTIWWRKQSLTKFTVSKWYSLMNFCCLFCLLHANFLKLQMCGDWYALVSSKQITGHQKGNTVCVLQPTCNSFHALLVTTFKTVHTCRTCVNFFDESTLLTNAHILL